MELRCSGSPGPEPGRGTAGAGSEGAGMEGCGEPGGGGLCRSPGGEGLLVGVCVSVSVFVGRLEVFWLGFRIFFCRPT